ncbi:membrane protein insertase YidC [Tistrella bauzanensis]|uniref:Membrane protein insertase YidC n=1 Tax=Tistrella bauzanensis TaxID=657419 RepID=A0ABQ1J0J1_9PROT|nr:membrane protein insertase YidC [Tistrella bauzanensis]GGB57038.1 membrane protein insertase YidC [Tistrella bauzanensis]
MPEQRNLMIAMVLMIAILFGYYLLVPQPQRPQQPAEIVSTEAGQTASGQTAPGQAGIPAAPGSGPAAQAPLDRAAALARDPRVRIDAPRISGSISLQGGRIDDVALVDYHETVDNSSPRIELLSPLGSNAAYYTQTGWVASDDSVPLPGPDTRWTADNEVLTPDRPVTLTWDNGQGQTFERVIAIDANYMFTVTDRVVNSGDAALTLYPYSLVSRSGTPQTLGFYILHEGPLGVLNGTLQEYDYDDLAERQGPISAPSTGGWFGITDKYWLAAVIPDTSDTVTARFGHTVVGGTSKYQVDYLGSAHEVAPGGTASNVSRVFAGAKELDVLDGYGDSLGIEKFDLAIDFGWFYFLTKPIFIVLLWIEGIVGNLGVSILILTLLTKALFFPLANKSYVAMSKMKKLQPELVKLRERHKDDKMRLNQEMMGLYKKEKVNPAAGCLPILVQIPVFFALYKVLFVTIEMRHKPFFGWIHDLSAPDPMYITNLFGMLPYTPPHFLAIGIWPVLMAITMFLQQKLNPAPADPMQAKVMMFLPVMFLFLFAGFPAGLVVYWTWNNLLSIGQQWLIMRRMGVKV